MRWTIRYRSNGEGEIDAMEREIHDVDQATAEARAMRFRAAGLVVLSVKPMTPNKMAGLLASMGLPQ